MINIKMVESNEEEVDDEEKKIKVVVVDVNIPFGSMITLMVRWAIASIPAFIILVFIGMFIGGILGGLLR